MHDLLFTGTYNRANSVNIKYAIILNIKHVIFNLHDTEVVICIILFLLKRVDGLNHYLNIRWNRVILSDE